MKNKVFLGDCLNILNDLDEESVDLIYLDPPFFTQSIQKLKTRDNLKEYYFSDNWNDLSNYLEFISERLKACKKVLKSTGSIFLHCDNNASHHLRIILDNIFGIENFQSEIIWYYKRWSNSKKGLLNSHQVIYFYTKTKSFLFNPLYTEYSKTTNVDQIFQERVRDKNGKSKYKIDGNGEVTKQKNKKGVPLSDVWEIPYLNPKAKERVGYPTQKPIILLEKIINLVTNPNDLVLDPFCGSGTTLVAAKLLKRNYIGIDVSEDAINLTKKRLNNPIRTESKKNQISNFLNEEILSDINSLSIFPVQRNLGIDGFLKISGKILPIPVRFQRKNESINQAKNKLLKACLKNQYKEKILIVKYKTEQNILFENKDENLIIIDVF